MQCVRTCGQMLRYIYTDDGNSRKLAKKYLSTRGRFIARIMAKRSGLAAACQASVTSISESYCRFKRCDESLYASSVWTNHTGSEYLTSVNLWTKFRRDRRIFIAMMSVSAIAIVAIVGLLVRECLTSDATNYVVDYFENPGDNKVACTTLLNDLNIFTIVSLRTAKTPESVPAECTAGIRGRTIRVSDDVVEFSGSCNL